MQLCYCLVLWFIKALFMLVGQVWDLHIWCLLVKFKAHFQTRSLILSIFLHLRISQIGNLQINAENFVKAMIMKTHNYLVQKNMFLNLRMNISIVYLLDRCRHLAFNRISMLRDLRMCFVGMRYLWMFLLVIFQFGMSSKFVFASQDYGNRLLWWHQPCSWSNLSTISTRISWK